MCIRIQTVSSDDNPDDEAGVDDNNLDDEAGDDDDIGDDGFDDSPKQNAQTDQIFGSTDPSDGKFTDQWVFLSRWRISWSRLARLGDDGDPPGHTQGY